ncbi:MAG: ABC transporter ATP-binding protein [Clostridiaceae bacterium]|nr:ABC transporter ATP-binding protein [Clostridiaceae bacterium]
MHLIGHYLRPYVRRMCGGLTIKLLGTIMDLLLPYILAHVIDDIVPRQDRHLVVVWGAVMAVCAVLALALNILANRMASAVARDTTRTLRHDLFFRIAWLSNRQVDDFTVPSLISRMTTDTYYIHRTVGMMQRIGVRAPILLIGGIGVTLALDPVLAAVLVAILPLTGIIVFYVSKKSVPMFTEAQASADRMVRVVRENTTGVRVIKALSKTEDEKKRFTEVNGQLMRAENRANMTMAVTKPTMNFILNGGLVLVVLVGAHRVNAGLSGAGAITAFLSYFTIILNAMLSVTRVLTMYSQALASAGRIQQVLDTPMQLLPEEYPARADGDSLRFEHVTFSYDKKEPTLEDISFSLLRGESLGIIGPTGAGKSTVAALLMRFYDVDDGGVYVGGRDVRTMEKNELRARFGVVFQNDVLFKNTVGENIRLGRKLTMEQIEEAAGAAQASDFIEGAGGMGAKVEAKGANFSGGQKQRMLIARALAGHPEFLILDDSSSALDYRTDAELRARLRAEYADTTTVIIAQRISSVQHCDHILVLEDGKTAGFGTHMELLESCALYRDIARLQMGVKA